MGSRRRQTSQPAPPPKEAAPIEEVERLLGYQFRNRRLLEEALTHKSVYPGGCGGPSYERLEFFGDAALALAVTKYLFSAHRSLSPGPLTIIRAANVSNETLARAAVRRRLFPNLARTVAKFTVDVAKATEEGGAKVKAPKVLADMVESIAAAIYLDCDFNLDILWPVLTKLLEPIITPVTALYQHCQKNGWSVEFSRSNDGSVNMEVFVNGQRLGVGTSTLDAAKDALEKLSAAETEEMEVHEPVVEEIHGCKQGPLFTIFMIFMLIFMLIFTIFMIFMLIFMLIFTIFEWLRKSKQSRGVAEREIIHGRTEAKAVS